MARKRKNEEWMEWYKRRKLSVTFRQLRIPNDTYDQLKKIAIEENTSVHELILTYIEWGLENNNVRQTSNIIKTSSIKALCAKST